MEKPILFNTKMVQAILEDRKTQTRRPVKPIKSHYIMDGMPTNNPPCNPGDILWVQETWCRWWMPHGEWHYCYKASDPNGNKRPTGPEYDDDWETRPWRPSIHMPKEAARIFLRVTDVRMERLQDITTVELQHEGILPPGYLSQFATMTSDCFERWRDLWDSTIKPADLDRYGWAANPWVWVIEFERIDGGPAGLFADRDAMQWNGGCAMGKHSDYKKADEISAWDMNKGCRGIVNQTSPARRKLRDRLKRQARKMVDALAKRLERDGE